MSVIDRKKRWKDARKSYMSENTRCASYLRICCEKLLSERRKVFRQTTILVVALGIRKEGDKKDVYERAKRLKQSGQLDLD